MDKLSFEKRDRDLMVKLHTSDSFGKFTTSVTGDIVINRTEGDRQYKVNIKNFFDEYSKIQALKLELANNEKFVIDYDQYKDSFRFFYSDTRDKTRLTQKGEYVCYGIGKETITEVFIINLIKFLDKESEVITEKCLINTEEKEIVNFYLSVLKRFEKSFSGENKDKVSKARTYLDQIWRDFPLINESYIKSIGKLLEGMEFRELEECAESIKDMQREIIRLSSLVREPNEIDKIDEYIVKYKRGRGSLSEAFNDSDIDKIPEIEQLKIIKLRKQIVRVRELLEIQYKYAPLEKKQKIMQYITVIKNFETKKYSPSEEDKVSTFRSLLDIFEGAEGISTLITGIPPIIFGLIVKIIKSLLALNDLKKEYKREQKGLIKYEETKYEEKRIQKDEVYVHPTTQIKWLKRQTKPTEVRSNKLIVEIVEEIIKRHGPRTVIGLKEIANHYNYRITKKQIQNAVYSSNRFYALGTKKRRYKGRLIEYNIYHVR
ncbi:MAG: hypothetical protein JW878_00310 [Methanomicrobia archaeon]|nr:hypothetical protein [Methanomicrobia archaeon]